MALQGAILAREIEWMTLRRVDYTIRTLLLAGCAADPQARLHIDALTPQSNNPTIGMTAHLDRPISHRGRPLPYTDRTLTWERERDSTLTFVQWQRRTVRRRDLEGASNAFIDLHLAAPLGDFNLHAVLRTRGLNRSERRFFSTGIADALQVDRFRLPRADFQPLPTRALLPLFSCMTTLLMLR